MDLRAKLAIVFLGIIVLPFLVVSVAQVDHSMGTMVEHLGDTGKLLADQTFEQIRFALAGTTSSKTADLVSVLRKAPSLSPFVSSSQALANGVVYARVEDLNGNLLAPVGPAFRQAARTGRILVAVDAYRRSME
jgi:hypothetical protein